eukprot:13493076-Alexandrium_andersonii.AAC.1
MDASDQVLRSRVLSRRPGPMRHSPIWTSTYNNAGGYFNHTRARADHTQCSGRHGSWQLPTRGPSPLPTQPNEPLSNRRVCA